MHQAITSRSGCRQGWWDGAIGRTLDHQEPSTVEQWTIVWRWVSVPGAAGLGHWLAVLSRRPWWVSMSDCWVPSPTGPQLIAHPGQRPRP